MKKIIAISIIAILIFTSLVTAESDWSDDWEFEYAEETYNPTLSQFSDNNASMQYESSGIFTLYSTLTFGGKLNVTEEVNLSVVLSNPNPANASTDISILQNSWNITMEDPEGGPFNWTIQSAVGNNFANGATNGSKNISIYTGNLTYSTTYTFYVNATDGNSDTNETFNFDTRAEYVPAPPTTFAAASNGRYTIDLSWDDNDENRTIIEWNTTADWPIGSGTELYNDTGTSTSDTGLSQGTKHYYQAWSYNATDNAYSTTNSTSDASTDWNDPPTLHVEVPTNESTGQLITISKLNITIEDPEGDSINWTINSSLGNQNNLTAEETNGSKNCTISGATYSTTYYWWVNATDGSNWTRAVYHFEIEDLDTILFTRVFQSPANIRMNDTTANISLYITYNLTTNNTDINETSVFLADVVNHTATGCLDSTWILPASIYHPDKREAINRVCGLGTPYWWEALFNNTGDGTLGDCGEWGVRNNSLSGNFTINNHGANWTNFSFNPRMNRIVSTIQFVDYSDRVKEDKSNQKLNVFLGNLVKVNFNMTDTCFYDVPQYNNSVYTFYYNIEQVGNPAAGLQMYFANNSYDISKGKPANSQYCELIKEIQYTDPITYQVSSGNSSYHNATFSVDADGKVGTVGMTSNWSIIFRKLSGNNAKKFQVLFADDNVSHGDHYHDFNQSLTTEISSTFGNTWAFRNGTVDCFINYISLDDEDQLMYKVYAQTVNDTHGGGNWSTIQTDLFDESNYAPNNPNVIYPNGTLGYNISYIGNTINITYTWLGDPNFDTCWVNITCHNKTHVELANLQNRSITAAEYAVNNTWYYNWDTTGMLAETDYHINITVTDPYGAMSFGVSNGTFELQDNLINVSINGSVGTEETNVTLLGQLINNGSYDTTCYFLVKNQSIDFATPDANVSAGVIANAAGFSSYIGNLSNGTFYYFRTRANNSYGWNNSWNTSYFLTKPQPATSIIGANIGGGLNISWTHGSGYNSSVLVVNENHWPETTGDGDNIYFGANDYYHHTGLTPGQDYYYRIWEYSNWNNPVVVQYSDGNESVKYNYAGQQQTFSDPEPVNESANVLVTLDNWTINISSSTGKTFNWTIQSAIGMNFSNNSANGTKEIVVTGNLSFATTYTIYVNASETTNNNWTNETFEFTTQSNTAPTISNPYPANESINVPLSTAYWNITIEDPEGHTFNWTIESPAGENNSDVASNGSKKITMTGNLSEGTEYFVWVNVSDIYGQESNATFNFTVQANNAPVISNPNPANESNAVATTIDYWNITIEDIEGNTFNWTIESVLGSNSSNADSNGSKKITITGNISFSTQYAIWVNTTDIYGAESNATYWFRAKDASLTLYATLSFGGKLDVTGVNPILSTPQPTNASTGIIMYPYLNITVTDPQSDKFNITWSSNHTGSWVDFAWNTSVTDGTFRQRATFVNASTTMYWWQARANDTSNNWGNATYYFTTKSYTWSNWSDPWTFNYSSEAPVYFNASTYNTTVINLTWSPVDGATDKYVVVRNETNYGDYPYYPSNGTIIYNGTNLTYNDTVLKSATTYYYGVWGWNETEEEYSIGNTTTMNTTDAPAGATTVDFQFPVNESTEVTRTPANISIHATGNDLNITFTWRNITLYPDVWQELKNWTEVNTGVFNVLDLATNWSTQFIWGNTEYQWWVNITNASSGWTNASYNYTTKSTVASSKNARYDVNNDEANDVFDLSADWANRDSEATYDGIYDVNNDSSIDVFDLSAIWANKS